MIPDPEGYTVIFLTADRYAYGCTGCGALAIDTDTHDRHCPAKEEARRAADYTKVFPPPELPSKP